MNESHQAYWTTYYKKLKGFETQSKLESPFLGRIGDELKPFTSLSAMSGNHSFRGSITHHLSNCLLVGR